MIELPIASQAEPVKRTKPDWLRVKLPIGESYKNVRNLVDTHKLHTICERWANAGAPARPLS
jgi:lipoyl synthase